MKGKKQTPINSLALRRFGIRGENVQVFGIGEKSVPTN